MTPGTQEGLPLRQTQSNTSDVANLPPPPNPSSDPKLEIPDRESPPITDDNDDLFKLTPRSAMKLLADGIEALVRITGDIPPTPPPTSPTFPNMRGMTAEKELIRSNSEKNLARLLREAQAAGGASSSSSSPRRPPIASHASGSGSSTTQPVDGVYLRQTPLATPPPPSKEPEPYVIVGENSQPLNVQHGAITRRFYSKQPPPISIEEYLTRVHRFCPMSTAVYLATSLYIHRLAVEEKAIPVAKRNSHRLVLAGLRVAMKALEDQSYPHNKFAKVGGVGEVELRRLEISFCFLVNFELVVTEETLKQHWQVLKDEQRQVLRPLQLVGIPTLSLNKLPKGKGKEAEGKENECN
ncbi:Cyclin-U4-1 [Colletotrichum chlorophyti]|uniref:Cyclin-U4-1 n=1 Tax=Colletotrichum chlorophyti TaxID=708187 RepID=A0A1Q8R9F6_9PEZI|nr:Cyclin-U4-1 [Colletotrichum chlorophyti]